MKKFTSILVPLFFTIFLFYLPALVNPNLLLNRSNDLDGFFWPIFYFVKQQLIENRQFPFWNNLFLSGAPLLPDPQSSLFYPPNIIFLFLPIDTAFVVSFILHTLLAAVGVFLTARLGFGLSKLASIFAASVFVTAPRLAGYLEAGHFGLIASYAWLPFIILGVLKLIKQPSMAWTSLLAISLAAVFYTHTVTFILAAISSLVIFSCLFLHQKSKVKLKSLIVLCLAYFLTFGLIAIALLPQLEWAPYTTRFLLLQNPDVYPKWTSLTEFFQNIFVPWASGLNNIWGIDTEKWLALGVMPSILAFIGFLKLEKRLKFIIIISLIPVVLIALNNSSPIYPLLLKQNWYALLRVATRVWFVPVLIVSLLGAVGFETLVRKKTNPKLIIVLVFLVFVELLFLSWARMLKPVTSDLQQAPKEIYEFLEQDKSHFRVFCVNRCLNQQEAAIARLELVEGYNTVQQINYYKHAWQLTGAYWDYYTLSIPPVGTYLFQELQPNAASLGDFNVKYVISPHNLNDKNFLLEKQFGKYLVYKNNLVKPRAYFWADGKSGEEAPILIYTPNHIRIDTSKMAARSLVLGEVWSPGWEAYLNGKEKVKVQETPIALRLVDIKPDTLFVDLRYQPESYKKGSFITLVTVLFLLTGGFKWALKI